MKVIALFGSPRPKSNSTALTEYFLSKLEKKGAVVKRFHLNKLKYRGCQGCMGCKTGSDKCVLRDDLTPALDAMHDADLLVLSSSVYYGDVTSQLKAFIDRIYSFYVPDFWLKDNPTRLPGGKQLVFVLTQGNADKKLFADIKPRYARLIATHGFNKSHLLRVCGMSPADDVMKRKDALKDADKLAAKLTAKI